MDASGHSRRRSRASRALPAAVAVGLGVLLIGAMPVAAVDPTPSPAVSPAASPTPTVRPTATPTPSPTERPTATPAPPAGTTPAPAAVAPQAPVPLKPLTGGEVSLTAATMTLGGTVTQQKATITGTKVLAVTASTAAFTGFVEQLPCSSGAAPVLTATSGTTTSMTSAALNLVSITATDSHGNHVTWASTNDNTTTPPLAPGTYTAVTLVVVQSSAATMTFSGGDAVASC